MAATGRILGALLLTILGVSSISAQCDWVTYDNQCAFGGTLYGGISNAYDCRRVCSNLSPRCKGYSWDPRGPPGSRCHFFYDQIDIPGSRYCEDGTTHVNLCLTTYPPYLSSVSAQCQDWVTYDNMCTSGGTLYGYPGISSDYECRRVCTNFQPRCKGYAWDTRGPPRCLLFYDQIDIRWSQHCADVTTHFNNCLTTFQPPYPYPTTTSDRPGRPDSSCEPIEGLGPGLVALIGIFCAIGGAILGMLLVCCCCPAKGFGRPSSDSHKSSTHKEKPTFVQTQGQVVEAGKVYSVPKSSLNGEPYSVSISVR